MVRGGQGAVEQSEEGESRGHEVTGVKKAGLYENFDWWEDLAVTLRTVWSHWQLQGRKVLWSKVYFSRVLRKKRKDKKWETKDSWSGEKPLLDSWTAAFSLGPRTQEREHWALRILIRGRKHHGGFPPHVLL